MDRICPYVESDGKTERCIGRPLTKAWVTCVAEAVVLSGRTRFRLRPKMAIGLRFDAAVRPGNQPLDGRRADGEARARGPDVIAESPPGRRQKRFGRYVQRFLLAPAY